MTLNVETGHLLSIAVTCGTFFLAAMWGLFHLTIFKPLDRIFKTLGNLTRTQAKHETDIAVIQTKLETINPQGEYNG